MAFGKGKDDKDMDKNSPSGSTVSAPGSGDKVEAFLGKGSKVVGSLTFTGPVELDGYVEGEIIAQDRLTVGEAAVVHAKITGAEVIVKGAVNGDIFASRRLALKKPARVIGNISTNNLSIEEGVIFEGRSSMEGPAKGDNKPKPPDKPAAVPGGHS